MPAPQTSAIDLLGPIRCTSRGPAAMLQDCSNGDGRQSGAGE